MSDEEKDYKIAYGITPGSFMKKDLIQAGLGGCDSIIVHSIVYPADGSRSEVIIDFDGYGEPLSADELFKSFGSLAQKLYLDDRLSTVKRAICENFFQLQRIAVLSARLGKDPLSHDHSFNELRNVIETAGILRKKADGLSEELRNQNENKRTD